MKTRQQWARIATYGVTNRADRERVLDWLMANQAVAGERANVLHASHEVLDGPGVMCRCSPCTVERGEPLM